MSISICTFSHCSGVPGGFSKQCLSAFGVVAICFLFAASSAAVTAHSGFRLSVASLYGSQDRDYVVRTAEDFQAILNAAGPGDVITLPAGSAITGNFTLPRKPGVDAGWITIRSSGVGGESLPQGARATPLQQNAMSKLVSPNSQPALTTEPGAHHYRFIGIEFTIAPDVMLNYGIVRLGEGDESDPMLLPRDLIFDRCYIHGHATADVSRGVALNSASTDVINSYISDCHGLGFDAQAIAGWNGPGPFRIINNYLEGSGENVLFGGADPKIAGLVPADIEFRNNHCAKPLSWKEGILLKPAGLVSGDAQIPGGLIAGSTYYYRISARARAGYSAVAASMSSDETAVNLSPQQTSVNLVWTPVSLATEYRVYRTSDGPSATSRKWIFYSTRGPSLVDVGDSTSAHSDSTPPESGTRWSVKNLFELKNARRAVIDGNVFENNWVDAQSGFAVQLTVRNQDGKAEWSSVEDVAFTNNIVRHSAAGINLLGRDNIHPSEQVKRINISGNLFDDLGGSEWGNNGRFLQITESIDVRVDHNTVLQTGNIITAYGVPNQGFSFSNNIALHNDYGIIGDGSSAGNITLDRYFPACVVKKNVIVGGQSARYPRKNYYPNTVEQVLFVDRANGNYRLSDESPYKNAGTKNRDVGADFEVLKASELRAIQGKP